MSRIKNKMGFTMLELLIVIAIVSILASVTFVSGRQIMRGQEQAAVLSQFKQAISRGASTASARGKAVTFKRDNGNFILFEKVSLKELQRFTLPDGVTINVPNGNILEFQSNGLINNLSSLPNPLTIVTSSKTYNIKISLIGEMKAQAQ
jgi:prepilin-type N-terminal cleavage/methylation domain-containing protein